MVSVIPIASLVHQSGAVPLDVGVVARGVTLAVTQHLFDDPLTSRLRTQNHNPN